MTDLRDIIENKESEPEQYKLWSDAFGGDDELQEQADNESCMIPDDEFEDYARELAEDIGAISKDTAWPYNCIDWEQAADELRSDYTSITVDGTDYLYR